MRRIRHPTAAAAAAALLAAGLLLFPSLVASVEASRAGLEAGHHQTSGTGKALLAHQKKHVPVLTKGTHLRVLRDDGGQGADQEAVDDSQEEPESNVSDAEEEEEEEEEAAAAAQVSGEEDMVEENTSRAVKGEESDKEAEPVGPRRSEAKGNEAVGGGDGDASVDESAVAEAAGDEEGEGKDGESDNKQSADGEGTADEKESTEDEPDEDVNKEQGKDANNSEEESNEDDTVSAHGDDVNGGGNDDEEEQSQGDVESKSEVVESANVSDDHTSDKEKGTAAKGEQSPRVEGTSDRKPHVNSAGTPPALNNRQHPSQKALSEPSGTAKSRAPMTIRSSQAQTHAETPSSPITSTQNTVITRGPLSRILGIFGILSSAKSSNTKTRGRRPWRRKKKKQTAEEMLYHDITLAFINGLKSGLYDDLDKPLSTERKQLLLDWCDLLSATLPPEFGLHRIINLLRSNWIHISSSRRNLMSILSVSLPAEKDYSNECTRPTKKRLFGAGRNSKSPSRGANCAFWRLLHTLSVGLAERKGGTDASTEDEVLRDVDAALGVVGGKHRRNHRPFSPMEAATIIRNVVDTFFTCEVCRKNFIEQYDSCQYGRCEKLKDATEGLTEDNWREMSLWLWQYHNGVTSTISRKAAAAEMSEARTISSGPTWPSARDCPSCQSADGNWDHTHVYQYLKEIYWGDEDIPTPPADTAYRMSDLHVLDMKSRPALILVGIIVVILALIRVWSRRYLLKHIGNLPLSSHLSGKANGKKE